MRCPLVTLVALLAGLSGAIQAQAEKLSDPLAEATSAVVTSVANSSDGLTFVYTTSAGGLYGVRIGAFSAVRLNEGVHGASPFGISADGTQVVFAGGAGSSAADLYVVPIDGSTLARRMNVSAALPGGFNFDLRKLTLTADGDVLFLAPVRGVVGGLQYGLFRAALAGDAPLVRLSPPVLGSGVTNFAFVPGSRRVLFVCSENLYRVDLPDGAAEEIGSGGGEIQVTADGSRFVFVHRTGAVGVYSRPVGDGAEIQLVARAVLPKYRLAPAGDRLVYLEVGTSNELFSIPVTGGSATRLNPTLPPGAAVQQDFSFSPDGSLVVYRADQAALFRYDLFSVPSDGSSAAQRLNGTLPSSGMVRAPFRISADGTYVGYLADQDVQGRVELYRAPIDGGASAKLNATLVAGGSVQDFELAPDSSRVVYSADQLTSGVVELFGVPAAGGTVHRLSPPLALGGDVQDYHVANDSKGVAILADASQHGAIELFGAPIDGQTGAVTLNAPLPRTPFGAVSDFAITPDSRLAVYLADAEHDGVTEIYSVPCDRSAGAEKRNAPIASGQSVGRIALAPDGGRIVYQVTDGSSSLVGVLFSTPTEGPGAAVSLGSIEARSFVVTSDGARVVFDASSGLHSVPVDGSAPPVQLSANEFDFVVSADGARVVYRSGDGPVDLFSIASDGASPPVRLTDLQASGLAMPTSAVYGPAYGITTDGARVVFVATGAGQAYPVRLFSVPIDGSSAAVELSGPLTGFRYVRNFLLGERVVYLADQDTLNVPELYGVPADGSAAPVKLSPPIVSSGSVQVGARLTPDGSRVLFAADPSVSGSLALFSAPVDGSSAAVQLPGTEGGYSIRDFSADGTRAVFTMNLPPDGLWSVATDGSASAVRISGALTAGGFVPIEVVLESVVFFTLDFAAGRQPLYVAPLDGSKPPRPLDAYPGPGGDIKFVVRVTPDGSRALYVSDEDRQYVNELFVTPLSLHGLVHAQRKR